MQDERYTMPIAEAIEAGLVSTYQTPTPEQAECAKAVLQQLADMDIATVSDQGNKLELFIISFLGDGYDVTVTRRNS